MIVPGRVGKMFSMGRVYAVKLCGFHCFTASTSSMEPCYASLEVNEGLLNPLFSLRCLLLTVMQNLLLLLGLDRQVA